MKRIALINNVHETRNGKTEWLPDSRVVVKTVKAHIEDEELRLMFEAGLQMMVDGAGCKWLSANRRLNAYTRKDVNWINDDWFPRMHTAGWKYWAIVEPANTLGNMSMKQFFGAYRDKGIEIQVFGSESDALAWLASKPNPARAPGRPPPNNG